MYFAFFRSSILEQHFVLLCQATNNYLNDSLLKPSQFIDFSKSKTKNNKTKTKYILRLRLVISQIIEISSLHQNPMPITIKKQKQKPFLSVKKIPTSINI